MPMFFQSGVPYAGSFTWATVPSAAIAGAGTVARISNAGSNGNYFVSNGTRWNALGGSAVLNFLGATVSGIAAVENIVLQTQIPAGLWQTSDRLRINIEGVSKSGAVDTALLNLRIGTAGTTADTAITGLSAYQLLSASSQSGGFEFDIKLVSATSAMKLGANATSNVSGLGGASASAAAAATVITDASANALWVSIGILSGGATNTVSVAGASIELKTP